MLREPLNERIVQNFHLVWLDENVEEKNDFYSNSIVQLREVVNTVNTFIDIDDCIDFITDRSEESAFMVVSDRYIPLLTPVAQDIRQIQSIYMFSLKYTSQVNWNNKCPKFIGRFTDIESICEVIHDAGKDCDHKCTHKY